jgi:hypothetical protein
MRRVTQCFMINGAWWFITEGSVPTTTPTTPPTTTPPTTTPPTTTPPTTTPPTTTTLTAGKIEFDKIKIGAGLIFFDDYSSLKRCLDSVKDGVDVVFAIDGKFPKFPGNYQLSTDGSRELTKHYPNCLLIDCPKPEFEKRTKYLEYSAHYSVDVLLIIDSDEFVIDNRDWKIFRSNIKKAIFNRDKCEYNVYSVMVQGLDKDDEFLLQRWNIMVVDTIVLETKILERLPCSIRKILFQW